MNQWESENINRLQKRVADISITSSVVRRVGFARAPAYARDFVANLNLNKLGQADEQTFVSLLDAKTAALQARLQGLRAEQPNATSTDASLWGTARKILNVFLCEAYLSRALESHYNLRTIAKWLEVPLDNQLARYIREKAKDYNLAPPCPFPGIIRLDEQVSRNFQERASRIAEKMHLAARIYLEIVGWRAGDNQRPRGS